MGMEVSEVIVLPIPKEFDAWEQLEIAERRVEHLKRELGLLAIEKGLEG
jgi:hypothetical protein